MIITIANLMPLLVVVTSANATSDFAFKLLHRPFAAVTIYVCLCAQQVFLRHIHLVKTKIAFRYMTENIAFFVVVT